MNFDFQKFLVEAASIDELLGPAYVEVTGQKQSTDRAAIRLAAWCRSAASGDWDVFFTRLRRDDLSVEGVLRRFADVRRLPNTPLPQWFVDAQWIYQVLLGDFGTQPRVLLTSNKVEPFEKLFYALVGLSEDKVIEKTSHQAVALLNDSARGDLYCGLLKQLTELYAPLLYGRFVVALKKHSPNGKLPPSTANEGAAQYNKFIEEIKRTELAMIFAEKPVLLRLTATLVRQWIETASELIIRLNSDITAIRTIITHSAPNVRVQAIVGNLSDPHNFGRSVHIVTFEDQTKLVYKPKDLRLDVAWHKLIDRFNASSPPVALKSVRTIACCEYGWSEFIEHTACESVQDVELFYRRSGAWLAVFHLFVSSDMHYENILAHGAHPVPIDLEMILQASAPEAEQETPETAALIEASYGLVNSVLMVGMLPSYAKSPNNQIFDAGGLSAVKSSAPVGVWKNVNTDGMRWSQVPSESPETQNVPNINGQYVKLGDYLPALIEGFEQYAHFLLKQSEVIDVKFLLSGFKQLPVRKVVRTTRFYYMLLQRLKDHRNMNDGVTWSAQAEFISRLAEWDAKDDLLWPLQRAERLALVNMNVPHFVSPSDGDLISDISGSRTETDAMPGLVRASERFSRWCQGEIDRQIEIIKVSTNFPSSVYAGVEKKIGYPFKRNLQETALKECDLSIFKTEVARIAATIRQQATIKDSSAAWIGLDWLGDSEASQLVVLGPDLYDGNTGVALFLSAYAHWAHDTMSRDLAFKALSTIRRQIAQPSAPRWARGLGVGGASGLGSIIYGLTIMSELLCNQSLLQDALAASDLFSVDLIAADRSLDVIAGSAGGILGLLALHRKTGSGDVLNKAIACGEHLLQQPRMGAMGFRSWVGLGLGDTPLTGFSHGASGFAHALESLAAATGRADFLAAAQECLAFEQSTYDKDHFNWPDFRDSTGSLRFRTQWCHGAIGIGLARVARGQANTNSLSTAKNDVDNAVENAIVNWPQNVDTLCCGTLGSIELLGSAGALFNHPALTELSSHRLAQLIGNRNKLGDYRWDTGSEAFNLGLFRGLSGVGYTVLRRLAPHLPNILIWE